MRTKGSVLDRCGDLVPPMPTSTPGPTTSDEAALAASVRVATDPILRFLDLQTSLAAPTNVARRPRCAAGGAAGVSGCQQFDCLASGTVTGTEEDCCTGNQLSRSFLDCVFDDRVTVVSLTGSFTLSSDTADVCTGETNRCSLADTFVTCNDGVF